MSQISEYDSPILRREVVPWRVGRDTAVALPVPSAVFNDCFIAEPNYGDRDSLSVRSLGAMSPFYRSRLASPISERDPVAWALNLGMMETAKLGASVHQTNTPVTLSSRGHPLIDNCPDSFPAQRVDAGVQTLDACLRFPKTGFASRRLPKRRTRKTKSVEIPREDAERELRGVRLAAPSPPPIDPHLRSKICKVRSFWSKANRALPTTFKVTYLCPLKRQSEFLDFSLKEILLEENPSNDFLFKSSPVHDDALSNGASIQSPWADDFDRFTLAD